MSQTAFSPIDLSQVPDDEPPARKTPTPGTHMMTVISSELKPTKSRDGTFLEVTFENKDKQTVVDRINVKNPSELATKIGLRRLKDLLTACGQDSNQFNDPNCFVDCKLKVKVVAGKKWTDGDGKKRKGGGVLSDDNPYKPA